MRVAAEVSEFDLPDYQRAARTILRHPLVTAGHPDVKALPLVRRWSRQLRDDLADLFGYRLEMYGETVRLLRVFDQPDPTQPATSKNDRVFDRQRYAYLALTLAALGRAGIQVTLSELADAVAADAGRIPGLGFAQDSYQQRMAFADAVGFLEQRGALRLADGAPTAWVSDPEQAEALYDIDRDVLVALFRPNRVLQHVESVEALLDIPTRSSENARRRAAGQAARRAVVEQSAAYHAEVSAEVANHLRAPALAEDLERLTGLRVERRADGIALVDQVGWSEHRFPGTGSVAQLALLLASEMAERVTNRETAGAEVTRLPAPSQAERRARLVPLLDAGRPPGGLLAEAAGRSEVAEGGAYETATAEHPFIPHTWLRSTAEQLLARYGAAFGEKWRADPDRLLGQAVEVLVRHRLAVEVPGGMLALPLCARYRGVQASVRRRGGQQADINQPAIFDRNGSVA